MCTPSTATATLTSESIASSTPTEPTTPTTRSERGRAAPSLYLNRISLPTAALLPPSPPSSRRAVAAVAAEPLRNASTASTLPSLARLLTRGQAELEYTVSNINNSNGRHRQLERRMKARRTTSNVVRGARGTDDNRRDVDTENQANADSGTDITHHRYDHGQNSDALQDLSQHIPFVAPAASDLTKILACALAILEDNQEEVARLP